MAKVRGLRGAIYERFDSEAEFARVLGWPKQKLNRITTGHREPTITEVNEFAQALKIPVSEVAEFFLQSRSPNGQLSA